MKKHNLAFIDIETTGLDPLKHEIIEFGCILAKQLPQVGRGPKLELIEEFEFKIKPEHLEMADPQALRINGYNEADWLFAGELKQVLKTVAEKTEGAIMVAQNVTFDWSFLDAGFKKTGIENKMHYPKLDLLSIAFARLYNDEKAQYFNLKSLTELCGLSNERAHTALADTRVTYEIYKKLLNA